MPASFENGTNGWRAQDSGAGCTSQTSDFHTDGSFGLRVDARALENRWFGVNFARPVDIAGKRAVSVDMRTPEVGTPAAIAVQLGDNWELCQSPDPWGAAEAGTDRLTVRVSSPPCPATALVQQT